MSLDGTALAGPFYAWSYDPSSPDCGSSSCFEESGAVVSGNSSGSNFVFTSANSAAALLQSNYFYVIQPWYNGGQTIAAQYAIGGNAPNASNYINYYNGQFAPANFSVTAAVPEPAAWVMMILGIGYVGLTLRRRRQETLVAA
jgi:hypothetical protein